jgi:hypothetical protein
MFPLPDKRYGGEGQRRERRIGGRFQTQGRPQRLLRREDIKVKVGKADGEEDDGRWGGGRSRG